MDPLCRNYSVLYSNNPSNNSNPSDNNSNNNNPSNRLCRPRILVSTLLACLEETSSLLNSRHNLRIPMVPSHRTLNSKEILLLHHSLEGLALANPSSQLHNQTNRSRISWHSWRNGSNKEKWLLAMILIIL